jgi:hypothetical protein
MNNKTEMRAAMRLACPSVPGDLLDHALDAALAVPASSAQQCGACSGCTDGCRLDRESPPCAPVERVEPIAYMRQDDSPYNNLVKCTFTCPGAFGVYGSPEDVRAVVDEPVVYQYRVKDWMIECFGVVIAADRQERNHRFLEEALELVQACNCGRDEAHQLVDYVYGREVGEKTQEVGGVMVTLAALCLAQNLDMHTASEAELARVWTKVEQIRAKQQAKPAIGPLPGAYPDRMTAPSTQLFQTMPPLPHPPRHWGFLEPNHEVPGYTLEQMKEYGAACIAAFAKHNTQ